MNGDRSNDTRGAHPLGAAHVILPALNEEEALPTLLGRLAALTPSTPALFVWVIDDGSTDRTAAIARQGVDGLDVRLISHPTNLGLGAALQSGISAVLQAAADDDFVVVMDADDTHDVTIIEPM